MNEAPPHTDESEPRSATARAYNELRERIISGRIAPGEKLKVDVLKRALDTGASPIREALSLLTSDQLVERLDQRGFRAAPVGAAQFTEILTLRCALEDIALRESIRRGGKEWEEALVLAHHRLVRTDRANVGPFEEKHKAFHMALLGACESPILLRFCGQLYDLNIRYRYLALNAVDYGKRNVAAEHVRILEAAVDRDAEAASERLIAHYRVTGQFLSSQLAAGASGPG